nr:hypothetical protein [uncultured Flavobacterium sp.]
MKTKNIYGILIGILIIFCGCNDKQKIYKDTQKVIIKYNNGKVFCEGMYSLNKKNGLPLKKVGVWKFYNANDTLVSFQQYDNSGELINYRKYNIDGVLQRSAVYTKNTGTEFYYFEDGKTEIEWIVRIETAEGDEGQDGESTTYGTLKEYYRNGQMAQQSSYIDDELNGAKNVWDEKGNLVLSVEYKDGFIITNKE